MILKANKMTVSISSLQNELLKLLNKDNDENVDELESGKIEGGSIPIENILSASNTINNDLSGGDNISGMVENILTGGNAKPNIENNTSDREIFTNILLEDSKTDEHNHDKLTNAEIINGILNEDGIKTINGGKDDDPPNDEGKDDNVESIDEEDDNVEGNDEEGEDGDTSDTSSGEGEESSDELSDYSEYSDSDDDEEEPSEFSAKYINIINEFNTPATKLTGGLVGGNTASSNTQNSRVKLISMFPYIVRNE